MSSNLVAEKKKQARLVKDQVRLVLRNYNLSPEELDKAAQDISDVVLTSWDLTLSNMDYAGTWFDQSQLTPKEIEE
ncbi:hypothetical protein [Pseudoalteromonas sp. MEBiC 03485]|uniref:hypothetical protein n=1 Tax=Pseudoalteromonas sp. MEBiC 03485 TaxID=2571103 RepID=UPI001022492B|nr:hypothetical protein [Pseudoalteromonas sp. MEBiC 03485]RZD19755.1 hypothetical protein EVU92_21365 [Pseudoalteromonas sp. MEBiC 03485]